VRLFFPRQQRLVFECFLKLGVGLSALDRYAEQAGETGEEIGSASSNCPGSALSTSRTPKYALPSAPFSISTLIARLTP
jgi:hypothetical protein